MMIEGRARGGPRDGIKITASSTWNGKVKEPRQREDAKIIRYYKGRYVWDGETWRWVINLKEGRGFVRGPQLDRKKAVTP